MQIDRLLEQVAAGESTVARATAPARLKSRIYSALVSRLAEAAPLQVLGETRACGGRLCVFEEVLAALPSSTGAGALNPCRICHARLLGEHLEHAPIFWAGCPYAEFHNP